MAEPTGPEGVSGVTGLLRAWSGGDQAAAAPGAQKTCDARNALRSGGLCHADMVSRSRQKFRANQGLHPLPNHRIGLDLNVRPHENPGEPGISFALQRFRLVVALN